MASNFKLCNIGKRSELLRVVNMLNKKRIVLAATHGMDILPVSNGEMIIYTKTKNSERLIVSAATL